MASHQTLRDRPIRAAAAAVLLVGVVACQGMVRNDFVDWDDVPLVAQAPRDAMFSAAFWKRIASGGREGMAFYPVFHLSVAVDRTLWGGHAAPYHLGNVLLHLGSALLLLYIGRGLLTRHAGMDEPHAVAAAAVGACLFAAHPVNVEPIAWVAGRKLALAVFFSLAAFACALGSGRALVLRTLIFVFFALAAMSNALALSLPLLLLAYDVWLRRRGVGAALLRRVELLALACLLASLRVHGPGVMAQPGRDSLWRPLTLHERLSASIAATGRELLSLAAPINQCNLYAVRRLHLWDASVVPALAFLVLVAAALWHWRRQRLLVFLAGWVFIGLLPTYLHDIPRADRHLYLAGGGAFLLAGWALVRSASALAARRRTVLYAASGLVSLSLVALTLAYVPCWRDTHTLWSRTVRVNPENITAQQGLGAAYKAAGYPELALQCYQNALRINPNYADAYRAMASVLFEQNHPREGEQAIRKALLLTPDDAIAHFIYGSYLSSVQRCDEAEEQLHRAVELAPEHLQAHVNLANLYCRTGRFAKGIALFREVLERNPTAWGAWLNLVQALDDTGRTDEAIRTAREARALAERHGADDILPQIDRYLVALRRKAPAEPKSP